jgi:hydroxymethylglutaryl-CoA lyase
MKHIHLVEVGPRDGFQFERKMIPTPLKLEIIRELVESGLRHIQVTSFVNPDKVPQMGDAEKLVRSLTEDKRVDYSALVLNLRGVERARAVGMKSLEVSISASDTHSRKNAGMSFDRAFRQVEEMILSARKEGIRVRGSIQCAFGCVYEGAIPIARVLNVVRKYLSLGVDSLSIADTTGMAAPPAVKDLLTKILTEIDQTPLGLHFHDTRGMGLVNVMAALTLGVNRFDTSMAGMGGCPFIPGAAGNIATEDAAWMMHSLGYQTGIDIAKVALISRKLETFFDKRFPGKMLRVIDGGFGVAFEKG